MNDLFYRTEIQKVNAAMTSGNLLSLDAFGKVGEFREDFFIDYVDIEYCFRLHRKNFEIFLLNSVILTHNEADLSKKKILNKTFYPHNHRPFRYYYKTRNLLYLRKSYKKLLPELLKIEYDSYIRTIIKMILFEKKRLEKIKMICLGFLAFLKKNTGKLK